MDFLKKHFEKILLSVILLGLAVAAGLLPLKVSQTRVFLDEELQQVQMLRPAEYTPVNVSTNLELINRLNEKIELSYVGEHNLFNPVQWKEDREGSWIKLQTGSEAGPGALQVRRIKPLHMRVFLESMEGTGESTRYRIGILNEGASKRPRPSFRSAEVGKQNDLFKILEVTPPGNPDTFHVQLKDRSKVVTFTRNQPYSEVVGYAVDLLYPREVHLLEDQRVGDAFRLKDDRREAYNIVAIDPDEVVVSASSTQKRTTIDVPQDAMTDSGNP